MKKTQISLLFVILLFLPFLFSISIIPQTDLCNPINIHISAYPNYYGKNQINILPLWKNGSFFEGESAVIQIGVLHSGDLEHIYHIKINVTKPDLSKISVNDYVSTDDDPKYLLELFLDQSGLWKVDTYAEYEWHNKYHHYNNGSITFNVSEIPIPPQPPIDYFISSFNITDSIFSPIENATVIFNNITQKTNGEGITSFNTTKNIYDLYIYKEGYNVITDVINVSSNKTYHYSMTEYIVYKNVTLTVNVTDSLTNTSITNVLVIVNNIGNLTDINGICIFSIANGTYNISAIKENYYVFNEYNISIQKNMTYSIELIAIIISPIPEELYIIKPINNYFSNPLYVTIDDFGSQQAFIGYYIENQSGYKKLNIFTRLYVKDATNNIVQTSSGYTQIDGGFTYIVPQNTFTKEEDYLIEIHVYNSTGEVNNATGVIHVRYIVKPQIDTVIKDSWDLSGIVIDESESGKEIFIAWYWKLFKEGVTSESIDGKIKLIGKDTISYDVSLTIQYDGQLLYTRLFIPYNTESSEDNYTVIFESKSLLMNYEMSLGSIIIYLHQESVEDEYTIFYVSLFSILAVITLGGTSVYYKYNKRKEEKFIAPKLKGFGSRLVMPKTNTYNKSIRYLQNKIEKILNKIKIEW